VRLSRHFPAAGEAAQRLKLQVAVRSDQCSNKKKIFKLSLSCRAPSQLFRSRQTRYHVRMNWYTRNLQNLRGIGIVIALVVIALVVGWHKLFP